MQPAQWQPVPGAQSVKVYAYIRKPDVFSSNSFVLRFPQQLLIIDPGGKPDQTQALVSVVQEVTHAQPMPVGIFLTHAHVDHTLEVLRNDLWRSFSSLRIALQENGAQALSAGDRRLTQAEILGCDLPGCRTDVSMFKLSNWETRASRLGPGAREWIQVGENDALEAYYTPGHSPDGVCFRVGEMLFAGDLLAAVSPLIAGAPGWEHQALVRSLESILQLVNTTRIAFCGLGHGGLLAGDAIPAAFRRALAEAADLARIEIADARRVRFLSDSAQELCEELSVLFSTIQSTINRVSERLHALEEFSAAQQIRQILRSDEVSELLAEFRNFREGLLAGEHIEVQLALKGVQVVHRISRLLECDKLAKIIDPALVSVTRLALSDFLQAAKGLRIQEPQTEVDVNAFITGMITELSQRPGARSLEEVPDDPAGFREYLIANIALASGLRTVKWNTVFLQGTIKAAVATPRFHDTVKCLLINLAEAGAKKITISASTLENSLRIEVDFEQPLFNFNESQISPFRRRFRLMGLKLVTRYERTGLVVMLPFNDAACRSNAI